MIRARDPRDARNRRKRGARVRGRPINLHVHRRRSLEARGEVVGKRARLELHADPALDARGIGENIHARDRRRASIRFSKSLEDLHRGGLPRSVRTEQAEDLALLDEEADSTDRFDLAVALAQVGDLDDVRHDSTLTAGDERGIREIVNEEYEWKKHHGRDDDTHDDRVRTTEPRVGDHERCRDRRENGNLRDQVERIGLVDHERVDDGSSEQPCREPDDREYAGVPHRIAQREEKSEAEARGPRRLR